MPDHHSGCASQDAVVLFIWHVLGLHMGAKHYAAVGCPNLETSRFIELSASFRRLSTLSLSFLGSFLSYPVELKWPCKALIAPVHLTQDYEEMPQTTDTFCACFSLLEAGACQGMGVVLGSLYKSAEL